MVGAGDIVADRLGRVAAEEDRAGVADLLRQRLGLCHFHRELDMLGRDGVDDGRRGLEIRHEDDGPIVAPARRRDLGTRQGLELVFDGSHDGIGEGRIVGDQHRLRGRIVLGLRQQVGRDPPGVVVPVGDHEDLGGAGDEVDADLAEHAALGGGDIRVAGPGDLVDRLDRCGAVRQGRHRLSAADAPDLVGAGDPCRAG